jgi:hypothetical protein
MALVATFANPPVDFARVQREWAAACDDLRVVLAQVDSARESFAVYRHLEALTRELMALTEQAAARCEDLMREA